MNNHRVLSQLNDPWVRAARSLIQKKKLTEKQLNDAVSTLRQRTNDSSAGTHRDEISLCDILVEGGHCHRHTLVAELASLVSVPYVHFSHEFIDPTTFDLFSNEFLNQHELLPVSCDNGILAIGCEQFADAELADEVSQMTGYEVTFIASDKSTNRRVREYFLDQTKGLNSTIESGPSFQNLICESEIDDIRVVEELVQEDADLNAASDSPVVNLVNRILASAYEQKASDIHIEPWSNGFIVRYRIDGKLRTIAEPPKALLSPVISRIKILSKLDIAERRIPQDGAFAVTVQGTTVEFRISTMTTKYGEKAVMRLVEHGSSVPSLIQLGIDESTDHQLRTIASQPNGMFLVTGPTGSGKTTTLYSMLDEICIDQRNISTIEDPVERKIQGASQFQINERVGFGFSMALRSLLRQDPDVIMVGEIRDLETAELAVQASLTGHLVLSTLHTNDSLSSLQRMKNIGIEPYLISASLRCVIAQRLIGRLCQNCKKLVEDIDPKRTPSVSQLLVHRESWDAEGCTSCGMTGINGRIGVYEFLKLNPDMCDLILTEKRHGMVPEPTMFEDGLRKVYQGLIGFRELLNTIPCPPDLIDQIQSTPHAQRSA